MSEQKKPKKSLQRKVGVVFLLLAVAFNLGSFLVLRVQIYPAFTQLEQEAASNDLRRVKQLLDSEARYLVSFGEEYSVWDETVDFVQGRSPDYVGSQVYPGTWDDAGIDMMAFLTMKGKLVWGQLQLPGGDRLVAEEMMSSLPLTIARAALKKWPVVLSKAGLLVTPEGVMLLSIQPILNNDRSNPDAGIFLIGRYVTQPVLDAYTSRLGVEFELYPLPGFAHMGDLNPESNEIYFPRESARYEYATDQIYGTETLRDMFGRRAVEARVHSSRAITALGNEISGFSTISMFAFSLLLVLLSWASVRWMVVNPITRLRSHMSQIRRTGDLSLSLDLKRDDELGALANEFGTMTDELRRTTRDLEVARDEALSSARMKSEFLASMSHEIRTPMNGVIGMTELLLKTDLSKAQLRLVDTVRSSANSLLAIINDVLDFSKMSAGKLVLDEKVFSLATLAREVNAVVTEPAQRKGLEYIYQEGEGVPPGLVGDDQRIRQILINLIGNAIKFTEQGEIVLSVGCKRTWWKDGVEWGLVSFTVTDTGIGIDKTAKQKIFSAFAQADSSTTRHFGGTGLGLAISRQLVELMGGKIDFDGVEGEGSRFWFTIPVRLERAVVSPSSEPVMDAKRLRDLKVMIVDDNATNRELLSAYLTSWGARVTEFREGEGALHALHDAAGRNAQYDLLIADYKMPGMTGLQLAEQVSREGSPGRPAIVILSSMAESFTTAELHACGVHSYLTKPVMREELYQQLSRAVDAAGTTERLEDDPVVQLEQEEFEPLSLEVLLVEDNRVNQELILLLLDSLGCKVAVAENGEQAIARLDKRSFDLVLMDCQMPVMDGFQATRIIRKRGFKSTSGETLPILALTANAMEGDRERCVEAGMDGYLAKPFRNEDLIDAIRQLLPEQSRASCIDDSRLAKLRAVQKEGQPSIVNHLIDVYLETSHDLINGLEEGVAMNDASLVQLNAHTLKSSSANLGAHQFSRLCAEVEERGRVAQLEDLRPIMQDVRLQFDQVCEELSRKRQQL